MYISSVGIFNGIIEKNMVDMVRILMKIIFQRIHCLLKLKKLPKIRYLLLLYLKIRTHMLLLAFNGYIGWEQIYFAMN